MKSIIFILLILLTTESIGQTNCDTIFYKTFYNFVKYDDSLGYSLNYHIDKVDNSCISDTTRLIQFIMSDEFFEVNSNIFREKRNDTIFINKGVHEIEISYLAHHTNHSKVKPLQDSSWQYSSNYSEIMRGQGFQAGISCPIDVLRLYFISSLFHDDFQFKNEIVLTNGEKYVYVDSVRRKSKAYPYDYYENKVMNKKLIKQAMKSYRKWEKELINSSLAEMRVQGKDPLYYAGDLKWRNKINNPF
ncbi:MAG: hypothetical protein ACPGTO_11740 [Polaribacter sp.]